MTYLCKMQHVHNTCCTKLKHMLVPKNVRPKWQGMWISDVCRSKPVTQSLRAHGAKNPANTSVTVAELLILLQIKPEVSYEAAEALLDSVWSLQYMTGPGILCAFAGASQAIPSASRDDSPAVSKDVGNAETTHTVHFRFSDSQALRRFLEQPEFVKVKEERMRELCQGHQIVGFEAGVEREMESMFRRGPDWGSGLEHILILQAREGEVQEAELYCSQLSEISTSRLCNAVQSQHGAVLQGLTGGTEAGQRSIVMMTRFLDLQDARLFLSLPPVSRILDGDPQLPLHLILQTAFKIAGTEGSKSTTPTASRLH